MKTLINILGTNRSGSTMLDLMLGNDSTSFSCGEVYAIYRPWRKRHFSIECSCGNNECKIWQTLKKIPENLFHIEVFNELNVKYVVDSSKNLAWILDVHRWHKEKIRIINLLIWKDPIDLAYSNWKRSQYFVDKKFSTNQLGIKYLKRLLSLRIPFIAINYKDLVNNPAKTIFEVCKTINVPYHKGKELFWMKKHHFLFGSDSVRSQINQNNQHIYDKENWPQDFVKIVPYLQKEINDDIELQRILKIINIYDIKNVQNYVDLDFSPPQIPFWYLYQKPKRFFQKLFPQV